MTNIKKHIVKMMLILTLAGWVSYPGWYHQYYYTYPQLYAYPASLSSQYDPHWGFWWY